MVLTGIAVYFWQNYEKLKSANLNNKISTDVQNKGLDEAKKPVENNIPSTSTPSPTATPSNETKAEVVFTPSGIFTEAERSQLYKKLIDPFLDFQKDTTIQTLTFQIEKKDPPVAGYKYSVNYINKGGSNGGLLYGQSTPLEWWLPECLNGCNFSDSFKENYPEIVDQLE